MAKAEKAAAYKRKHPPKSNCCGCFDCCGHTKKKKEKKETLDDAFERMRK